MKRRIMLSYQLILLISFFIFASSYSIAQGGDSESCCDRDIGTPRVQMPTDQYTDWGGFMEVSSEQFFFESPVRENLWDECPIEITFKHIDGLMDWYNLINKIDSIYYKKVDPLQIESQKKLEELDYLIIGTITPEKITGKTEIWCEEGYEPGSEVCWGGNLIGSFRFKWELIDNHHNKAVVKSLETSWDGEIHDYMGYAKPGDKKTYFDKITEVTKSVANLDEVINDYEQMPLSCKVKLEDDLDYVENGETIKINLNEINDFKGRTAKEWQYLMVKVDKGKITNGIPCRDCGRGDEEYKIFEVGDGKVEINYKAPDECKNQKEKIYIYNTCEHRVYKAEWSDSFNPKKEIANKEFDIICTRGYIEYNHEIVVANPGYNETIKVTGSIPFKMKKPKDKQKEPPKLEGKGSVNVSIQGTTPVCTMSGGTTINILLNGEIKTEKEGDYLLIDLDEDWNKTIPWKWNCPGISFDKDRNFYSQKDDFNGLKFKREDGFKLSESFSNPGMQGKYEWTLHFGK